MVRLLNNSANNPVGGQAMFKLLRKLRKDERAVTAIEYGLIVALIGVAALVAMSAVGTSLNAMFSSIATELTNAIGS